MYFDPSKYDGQDGSPPDGGGYNVAPGIYDDSDNNPQDRESSRLGDLGRDAAGELKDRAVERGKDWLKDRAAQREGEALGKAAGNTVGSAAGSTGAGAGTGAGTAAGTGAGAAAGSGAAAAGAGTGAGAAAAGTGAGAAAGSGAAAAGAGTGAAAGSVAPGVGTAIGAAAGVAVGAATGAAAKKKAQSKGGSGGKKSSGMGLVFASIIAVGVIVVLFSLFTTFLGKFKVLHYASALGRIGFAATEQVMKLAFTQGILDDAIPQAIALSEGKSVAVNGDGGNVLAATTEGTIFLDSVTNRLKDLGKTGQLTMTTGAEGGLSITLTRGDLTYVTYNIDDKAKELFGSPFNSLGQSQQWEARSEFNKLISDDLTKVLAQDKLFYRDKVFNALRATSTIDMYRWLDKGEQIRDQSIQEGRTSNMTELIKRSLDSETLPPVPGDDAFAEEAKQYQKDIYQANESAKSVREVREERGVSLFGSSASGIGDGFNSEVFNSSLYCLIKYIDQVYQQQKILKEYKSIANGHDTQTVADEIMADRVSSAVVNREAERLDGMERSAAYKYMFGRVINQTDIDKFMDMPPIYDDNAFLEMIHIFNQASNFSVVGIFDWVLGALSSFIPAVPEDVCSSGFDTILQWFTSPGGPLLAAFDAINNLFGNDLDSNGLQSAVRGYLRAGPTTGLYLMIGKIINMQLQTVSGEAFSGSVNGLDGINQGWASVQNLNNHASRSYTYCAPVDRDKEVETTLQAMADVRKRSNEGSLSERYFAITNPFSLVGRTVAQIPTTPNGLTRNLYDFSSRAASTLTDPLQLVNGVSSVLMPKAGAAALTSSTMNISSVDLGVQACMWTKDEIKTIMTNPAFEYSALEADIAPRITELDVTYLNNDCFVPVLQSKITNPECFNRDNFTSEEALRWRYWHLLQNTRRDEKASLADFSGSAMAPTALLASSGSSTAGTGMPADGVWAHPAPGRPIKQLFGVYHSAGYNDKHTGIDFGGSFTALAACNGIVSKIKTDVALDKYEWTYAHAVVIRCNGDQYEAGYHHVAASPGLTVGQRVNAGDPIGQTDSSGIATGDHLHFTIRNLNAMDNGMIGFEDPKIVMGGVI